MSPVPVYFPDADLLQRLLLQLAALASQVQWALDPILLLGVIASLGGAVLGWRLGEKDLIRIFVMVAVSCLAFAVFNYFVVGITHYAAGLCF